MDGLHRNVRIIYALAFFHMFMLIGSVAQGIGYLWLNFADGFMGLAIFALILGVAVSMMSGVDLALLYDTE